MEDPAQKNNSISRRGFLKLAFATLASGLAAPLIASCTPKQRRVYEVDIVIEQSEIHYSPDVISIPRGATVTWLNKSFYSQSVTCDPDWASHGAVVSLPGSAQPWDSGLLYPGQRFSKTFDTPGTYIYFSATRLSPNAVGTVIVD